MISRGEPGEREKTSVLIGGFWSLVVHSLALLILQTYDGPRAPNAPGIDGTGAITVLATLSSMAGDGTGAGEPSGTEVVLIPESAPRIGAANEDAVSPTAPEPLSPETPKLAPLAEVVQPEVGPVAAPFDEKQTVVQETSHQSIASVQDAGSSRSNGPAPGPDGRGSGRPSGNGGHTEFFSLSASGRVFVFVIDASQSMQYRNAFRTAREELLRGLQFLGPQDQFQIIVFNTVATLMTRPHSRQGLCRGTDINRRLAVQFLDGVFVDGGTDRMAALRLALKLNPEVIFLLSDADEPALTAGDLDEVRRLNRSRAQIHTVEFGRGADLGYENFFTQLARENNGAHCYHQIDREPVVAPAR